MFGKLKEKLKSAINSFTQQVEPEVKEEPQEERQEVPKDAEQIQKPQEESQEVPEVVEHVKKPKETKPPEKAQEVKSKSFFSTVSEKITTVALSEERFEELFWELELGLLENNVALEAIEKIKADLKKILTENRIRRSSIAQTIEDQLRESLKELLQAPTFLLHEEAKQHSPYVIAIVGVNGAGKTTTIAKLTKYFQLHKQSVVLAAGDTFRAAAIQQLQEHAKQLDVPVITQGYGADPAAVAYDAIAHAKAKNKDVVIIDTAGRMHSNKNLMDELHKVIRVAKPHRTLFIGESTTGNDCIEQAKHFDKIVSLDGIILSKADVDEKGGASISVSYITKKPILFLGTGQNHEDLEVFDPQTIIDKLL